MTGWRRADALDAPALTRVEREANLVGRAPGFDPAEFPFPSAGVEARWTATLAADGVVVELLEDPGPVALVAWDGDGRLRHLAVVPERWGRGLGQEAVSRAVAAIRDRRQVPRLWVLVANGRARRVYERLGWRPTGRRQRSEWAPYPEELEMELPESPAWPTSCSGSPTSSTP